MEANGEQERGHHVGLDNQSFSWKVHLLVRLLAISLEFADRRSDPGDKVIAAQFTGCQRENYRLRVVN